MIHDSAPLDIFNDYHLDVFLIRTLVRDSRFDTEREQAFRYIRRYLEHPGGPQNIPQSVVRILVSLLEQLDDKFCAIAAETLCEIGRVVNVALFNPEIVSFTGGYKTLFQWIIDGPSTLIKPIVASFMQLLDSPSQRGYLRPFVEIDVYSIDLDDFMSIY